MTGSSELLWMTCASSLSSRKHEPLATSVVVPLASTEAVPLITAESSSSGWQSRGLLTPGGTVYHMALNGMTSPSPYCSHRATSTSPTAYDSAVPLTKCRIEPFSDLGDHRESNDYEALSKYVMANQTTRHKSSCAKRPNRAHGQRKRITDTAGRTI